MRDHRYQNDNETKTEMTPHKENSLPIEITPLPLAGDHLTQISISQSLFPDQSTLNLSTSSPTFSLSKQRLPTPTKQANLSIIRSPIARQVHGNKNKFNEESVSWEPTKVGEKYNERFQTTAVLREAAKMNAILFDA